MYKRSVFHNIFNRLVEPRRFLQVLAGPRQTGKTTLARQILEDFSHPAHYASADEPMLKSPLWLEQQWEVLRARLRSSPSPHSGLLVLDEIQKLPHWAEGVKRLWDEDSMTHLPIQVLLLGSSPLLIQQGLSESLAGRFEVTPVTHWSFAEMREAFGWSLDQYLFFGGYPGSAALIDDESRWKRYLLDSLIETTVGRDILLLTRVDKPALLRRLFELGCAYSGQILSYQKNGG